MADVDIELWALAAQIAADLFTNGSGEKAQRLVLTVDPPTPRNLGGWSERGATDRVYRVLLKERAK